MKTSSGKHNITLTHDEKIRRTKVIYMTDITTIADEKGRALAKESGRKEGAAEERALEKQKGGLGRWVMPIIWLIVLACIIIVASLMTLSVSVTNTAPGVSLPFTTMYGVSFPEGQDIAIGDTHISVMSYENELISDIDGDRQKLVVGEARMISERRAVIKTLGMITLMDTNFRIGLTYKGDRENRAYFDMAVQTSQQVPHYLLEQLLPPAIDARPL